MSETAAITDVIDADCYLTSPPTHGSPGMEHDDENRAGKTFRKRQR
jgi:hypothetical protein